MITQFLRQEFASAVGLDAMTLLKFELLMANSIMYQEDGYVVLESDREEQFMTAGELIPKLASLLVSPEVVIPRELEQFDNPELQAQHLLENYFELDIGADKYLQWYVVRLEKP